MIQKLLAKLNSKFVIFFYVFAALNIIANICSFINEATTYNLSTLSYFYSVASIVIGLAFFGFGAFLLFRKDSAKFKTFFSMYVVYFVIASIFSLRAVFAYPMYDSTPAVLVIFYILCIISILVLGCFAICYFLNKFYPNPIFMTISNIALIVCLGLDLVMIIVLIVGIAQQYISWSSLVAYIEEISLFCVLLLGINNKEITD